MLKQDTRRKTPRVIELDARGRPRRRWRQWFTRVFKVTVQLAGLYAFVRTWGLKALVAIAALAATAGAALVAD